jgi:hypothetical protein
MSTHIVGFKLPGEKWYHMRAIWDGCKKANIDIPKEVLKYFNHEEPNDTGVEVELPHHKWSDHMKAGLEIEVESIPKDITLIRFYNSW